MESGQKARSNGGTISEARDCDEIAALMNREWKPPRTEFTREVIGAYLGRPTAREGISLGYFLDGKLEGYIYFTPCDVLHGGRHLKVMFGRWWTSARRLLFHGCGLKLMERAHVLANDNGYDAFLGVTYAGSQADASNCKVFERLGLRYELSKTFGQLMASPKTVRNRITALPGDGVGSKVTAWAATWHDLINSSRAEFTAQLSPEDTEFILLSRTESHTWGVPGKALLNCSLRLFRGEQTVQNAYIDHLVVDQLSPSEQLAFFQTVFADPIWGQVAGVYIADSGCLPSETLRQLGFCRTLKKFNLYQIPYHGQQARAFKTFNLEIF